MYWTKWDGLVMKSVMDGTSSVQIVSELANPTGITVDYKASRLFWVEYGSKNLKSSEMDGGSIATLAGLGPYSPYGIAVDATRVYFGSYSSTPAVLRSCNKTGGDVKVLYTHHGDEMQQIALITSPPPTTTRINDCATQNCSHLSLIERLIYPHWYLCSHTQLLQLFKLLRPFNFMFAECSNCTVRKSNVSSFLLLQCIKIFPFINHI